MAGWSAHDASHMRRALELARAQLGKTAPNPAVGCVLVGPDGAVVGEGATQPGGRPHAEAAALQIAGEKARGAVAYVTLEPCAHHGQTPPCAESLIEAGVAEVVMACRDPDPRVSGGGAAMLERAGVRVREGLFVYEALQLNAGFFHRLATGRPLLVMADTDEGFDAELTLENRETLHTALDRLGNAGMTRVFARRGSGVAAQAQALGFGV